MGGGLVLITSEAILEAQPMSRLTGEVTYPQGQWCLQNFLCPGQLGWQPHSHSLSFEEHSKLGLFF